VHAKGVIHRDLKSENIFLITRTGEDFVKVLDFGVAKLAGNKRPSVFDTADGITVGTPLFMSPEQAMGEAIDPQSDVYSLGVVLFHMATKGYPFYDVNPIVVGNMHINQPVPKPRSRNPNLSSKLEAVILRCLEKKREHRYANAAQVAAALGEACELDTAAYMGQKTPFKTKQLPATVTPLKPQPFIAGWIFAALALGLIGGLTYYIISAPAPIPAPTQPAPAAPPPIEAAPQSQPQSLPQVAPDPTPTKSAQKPKTSKNKKVTEKTTLNPFKNK
jgi:serine/threonine protein kinase